MNLLPLPTVEDIENYFRQRPYYFTDDGTHFYANPSHRKAKGLHYIGRFLGAKEARQRYNETQRILKEAKKLL